MHVTSNSDGQKQRNGPKLEGKEVSILVADDDPAMRSLVSDELRDEGYRVFQVSDGLEALEGLAQFHPDLVITDLRMPHGGMEVVARIKSLVPKTPVILMTAFGDKETESLAYKWGASAYFNKPVRMAELKEAVKNLLDDDGPAKTTNGGKGDHGG
jgi:DNA-binding response OmpR family regulator